MLDDEIQELEQELDRAAEAPALRGETKPQFKARLIAEGRWQHFLQVREDIATLLAATTNLSPVEIRREANKQARALFAIGAPPVPESPVIARADGALPKPSPMPARPGSQGFDGEAVRRRPISQGPAAKRLPTSRILDDILWAYDNFGKKSITSEAQCPTAGAWMWVERARGAPAERKAFVEIASKLAVDVAKKRELKEKEVSRFSDDGTATLELIAKVRAAWKGDDPDLAAMQARAHEEALHAEPELVGAESSWMEDVE